MRHLFCFCLALCTALLVGPPASAVVVTFSDGSGCSTPEVEIRAGLAREPCVYSPNGMDRSGAIKRTSRRGDAFWTARFASPVRDISIRLGDRSADGDRLFLEAFGPHDTLLARATFDSLGQNGQNHWLKLEVAGVLSARFGVLGDLGAGSGIFADTLRFSVMRNQSDPVTPVPLPAASFLLVLSLSLCVYFGNRVD